MKFRDYLNERGIVATIRRELGTDIDAACGQLRKKEVEKCLHLQKPIRVEQEKQIKTIFIYQKICKI